MWCLWHWALSPLFGLFLVACGALPVFGGTFANCKKFSAWNVGYDDLVRIEAEVTPELQPCIDHFFACERQTNVELRYDGKSFGLAQPYVPNLDFDLPVDSFGRSTTITFGPALFKMDLPFLQFDEAAATYSFRDRWNFGPGSGLASEEQIRLTDVHSGLTPEPFDPESLIRKNLYDIEGARVSESSWADGRKDVSQMLSAVVMGYDLEDLPEERRMAATFGAISSIELDGDSNSQDVGIVGILAMLALGGAALFITLEINRDKFDKYR